MPIRRQRPVRFLAVAAAAATARNRTGRWRRIGMPGEGLRSRAAGAAGLNIVGFMVPSMLRWWKRVTTGWEVGSGRRVRTR